MFCIVSLLLSAYLGVAARSGRGPVLETIDVIVDGGVEDGEEVGELGDAVHPVWPGKLLVRLTTTKYFLNNFSSSLPVQLLIG